MVPFKKNRNTKPRRGDTLTAGPRIHEPVLTIEILQYTSTNARRIIDATLGSGGHALVMLQKAVDAELLGIDQDEAMAQRAKENLSSVSDRVNIIVANFREIDLAAKDIGWEMADVILFDLGFSSVQLENPQYGLSFQRSGPLDMRLDRSSPLTAAEIVNGWRKEEIEHLLRELGEEQFAKRISQAIVANRPLESTSELAEIVTAAIPGRVRRKRPNHPATNTFRALRMAVNDELGALREALPKAINLLAPSGILIVVSFNSLEDRVVKNAFRSEPTLTILTKKPIVPTTREIAGNPRARSAKLRVAIKANSE